MYFVLHLCYGFTAPQFHLFASGWVLWRNRVVRGGSKGADFAVFAGPAHPIGRTPFDSFTAKFPDALLRLACGGRKESSCYVVSADNKWFTRVVVASAVIDALASLNLQYPKVSAARKKDLAEARKLLLASK